MKRACVDLRGVDASRYITSPQMPGVLIINTNARPQTMAKLLRLPDGQLSSGAVRYVKEMALQRGNAERAEENSQSSIH